MKTRIVERTCVDGRFDYVIQKKSFVFGWYDAYFETYSDEGHADKAYFATLKEAQEHLCYFNGSKPREKVVFEQ
jgi:hypothetical protein